MWLVLISDVDTSYSKSGEDEPFVASLLIRQTDFLLFLL